MTNSFINNMLSVQRININPGETLILTFNDGLDLDTVRDTMEMWSRRFPNNFILSNFSSLVKSITVVASKDGTPRVSFTYLAEDNDNEFLTEDIKKVFLL